MRLQGLIDFCQAVAIADSLTAGEETNYRYICRHYSKTFHTPLHVVYTLDPEDVIRAFFEDQMDARDTEKDIESILDRIYELEDPNYVKAKKTEVSEFIKLAEKEERERIAAKKPIHPGMRFESEVSLENTSEVASKEGFENPTGGSIDLSYLSDSDSEE